MVISSGERPLTELVRRLVRQELQRKETTGGGGNTLITSEKDLHLVTRGTYKIYANGIAIGSGSGTITGSGTTNYLPRFTGATAIGNSHLIDDGSTITSSEDIEMLAKKTVYYNGLKTGEIFSKKTAVETIDYYGLQITPYNTHGTNPGSLYIGDNYAAPAGIGIKITDTAISLIPVSGGQINVYGTVASQETEGTSLYRMKINDSSTPPSVGKGGIYVDTDDNNAYLNKGTYASPNWQLFGVIDHGALTGLGDDDHTQYFLADGTRSLTGDASILAEHAWKFYDTSSNLNGKIYADLDVEVARHFYIWASATTYIDLKPATGSAIIATGGSIYLQATTDINAGSTKIVNLAAGTVAGDALRYEQLIGAYLPIGGGTLIGDLTIKEASPMLYFQDASANPLGSIGSLGGGFYIGNDVDSGSIYLRTGATPATRVQIYDTGVVLGVPLAMSSNKITGLANPTDAQDAVTKAYFEANALTNPLLTDLTIKEASPMLYFQNASGNPLGSIGSLGGGFYIGNDVDAGSIYLRTGATPATRVQIYDTGVTLGVPLSMGTQKIYFSDGYGIDFRNDGVHKIAYAAGTNSLDIQSYQTINFKTTYDSGTPLSAAQDGVRLGEALFLRKNHAADNCYIVDDASGTMELHVPSGQCLKVVIG